MKSGTARPGIMLVTPNLEVGGAQEAAVNVARSLKRLGRPVLFATFEDGPLRSDVENAGVSVAVLGARRNSVVNLPRFSLEMLRKRAALRRLVSSHDIGVVLTQGLGTLDFLILTLRSMRNLQVWWTIQNERFTLRPEHLPRHRWLLRPKQAAHRFLYKWGSRLATGVIAVSEATAEAVSREAGVDETRVTTIYNAVDTDRFPAARPRAAIRAELGFPRGVHLMVMVGTFKRQKGHDYLLMAAAKLAPRFPDWRLLLVGDGELREHCQRRTAELGLEDQILFLGTRRDIPELLTACDSFVLPSLWEGLPVALIEAMAAELPTIATDVSGSRFALIDGVTGWLVPPGEPDALVEAIEQVLSDPEEAAARGRAGRQRADEVFSARGQAEQLVSLFDSRQKL